MIVSLDSSRERGRLALEAMLGVPRLATWREAMRLVLGDLLDLIQIGGLAGHVIPAGDSSATLDFLTAEEHRIQLALVNTHIDPAGLVVVRNVFSFMDREVVEVKHLRLGWDGALPVDWLSRAHLPVGYVAPPFDLDIELVRDAVDVEVYHSGDTDAANELVRRFGTWFGVVSSGGYDPNPRHPPATSIALDDAPDVVPGLVHFAIVEVRCDDAAFDALVNIVQRFHSEVARVSALSME
jgi:hypothetical protein